MMASLEQVQIINIAANCFWSVEKQEEVKSAREYVWTWTKVSIFVRIGLNSQFRQKKLHLKALLSPKVGLIY